MTHTAKGPYNSIDPVVGKRHLDDTIATAKRRLQRLQRKLEIASQETNTPAKAVLLREVADEAINCSELYGALAIMKQCRFIDYDQEI